MFSQATKAEKDLTSDFYVHNFSLYHPYSGSPNSYVGDVQLRSFFSWIAHEIKSTDEMASYREEENQYYLWLRPKATIVQEIIKSHQALVIDEELAPIL